MATSATLEQSVEALIDLVCGQVLARLPSESVRRQAQDLLIADHGRRLERDGKHPQTGEAAAKPAKEVK